MTYVDSELPPLPDYFRTIELSRHLSPNLQMPHLTMVFTRGINMLWNEPQHQDNQDSTASENGVAEVSDESGQNTIQTSDHTKRARERTLERDQYHVEPFGAVLTPTKLPVKQFETPGLTALKLRTYPMPPLTGLMDAEKASGMRDADASPVKDSLATRVEWHEKSPVVQSAYNAVAGVPGLPFFLDSPATFFPREGKSNNLQTPIEYARPAAVSLSYVNLPASYNGAAFSPGLKDASQVFSFSSLPAPFRSSAISMPGLNPTAIVSGRNSGQEGANIPADIGETELRTIAEEENFPTRGERAISVNLNRPLIETLLVQNAAASGTGNIKTKVEEALLEIINTAISTL